MVSTEAVFLTTLIDAHENQCVSTVDIPGSFMQANMDEDVFMWIDGHMAELLLEIGYDMYQPHVMYKHNEPMIYVELLKVLYGMMRAAQLFWEKLSTKITGVGFCNK